MATETEPSLDAYLALVPRGFQHVACESIIEQLSGHTVQVKIVGEAIADESDFLGKLATLLKTQQEKSRKKNNDIEPCCSLPVGSSVSVPDSKHFKNVSIGYTDKTKPTWACSGVLPGVVWIQISTSAPVEFMAKNLRVVGPLIALVNLWEDIQMTASQSLDQAVDSIREIVKSKEYPFSEATDLWHRHVQSSWNLSKEALESTSNKMKGLEAMKYRLSMIRSDSEKFQYTRQDFLTKAADIVVPAQQSWKVDLTAYDLEVVLLMHPRALAIGVSLRPYQHLKVKSFALGGIPPDVSPPVLPGEVLAKIIRLRPTTAHLLLHVAKVEPGDVVLDPCAGVGTIPLEVMFHRPGAVGLGGDLVLTPEAIGPIAASNEKEARSLQKAMHPSSTSCTNLMAWDATCLPLRTGSVDVIISDLPFGQQCLSKAKLDGILPLMFSEMARVLRPHTGRIVLLCGNHVPIARALNQLNSEQDSNEETIITPFDSIFPTNIGGLLAWCVVARRGGGSPRAIQNYRDRVRKMTGKRERIERTKGNDKKSKKRSDFQS